MNIITIHSSPRKNSVTSSILTQIERKVNLNHKLDSFNINTLNIKPCTGCLKCRPNNECTLPKDDAHVLSDKIKQADLIIIGVPTFWGNMPGVLKIFFDRCVTTFEYVRVSSELSIPKKMLKGKMAILVVSSASPFPYNQLLSQSRGAIRSVKTILKAGGIKISKIINVSSSYKFDGKRREKYLKNAKKIGMEI